MRNYGTPLLHTFADNPVLYAPEFKTSLFALAESRNSNWMASLAQTIGSSLGIGGKDAREIHRVDHTASMDNVCQSMGLGVTDRSKPFAFAEGIAVIPMWGSLLHRDSYCDSSATGYDFLRSRYNAAMADPDVKGIIFDVNSPGGHVAGNFELADEIRAGRNVKPSMALVDAACYSGGYSLSSAMNRIVVTPSSGVGSIGVVMMHLNVAGLMEKYGLAVDFVFAGDHKVDGNMFSALPEEVRSRYQASVERSYGKFVSLVAENRGMSAEDVRGTQALCFDAEQALSLGLIDAIQTAPAAVEAFRSELSGSTTISHKGVSQMSSTAQQNQGGGADQQAAADANTQNVSTTDAVKADRQRSQAIISCDEAKGRESMAQHLALNMDMSVDDAKKLLATAPKAEASVDTASATFAAAMNHGDNPNVGSDDGSAVSADATNKKSVAARIAANHRAATGYVPRD